MYGIGKSGFVESSYQVNDDLTIPVYADVQLYPCSICGRNFNSDTLVKRGKIFHWRKFFFFSNTQRKHQPICKKTTQKATRRVFDTGKQRATDSDVPYSATKETTQVSEKKTFQYLFFDKLYMLIQVYIEGVKPKADKKRTTNWREDHDALVRTIREARQITKAIETGAPIPKQTPSQIPAGYVQCDYCQRHFNKHTAERHIPL